MGSPQPGLQAEKETEKEVRVEGEFSKNNRVFIVLKRGIIKDIILFIAVLIFLMIVIPLISSIFKQLIILQILILIAGTIVLTYIVKKARGKENQKGGKG